MHSVLVVTVVHRPDDARILHRQVAALLDADVEVTVAGPWAATGATAPAGVTTLELPRAAGRARLAALRAARRLLRTHVGEHDLVLLHDPELLLALPGLRLPPVVWDVHEDLAASLVDRAWVPALLRRPLQLAVRGVERWAERRCAGLLLAEHGYADRFRRPHPVVPNVPIVPTTVEPPDDDRVLYVGRISRSRGAREMVELGRRLVGAAVVELVGPADADVEQLLADADARGEVRWYGFEPNDVALARLDGAACGLSLLHDEPNYRHSMPTKVLEYLAHGLPVITTPLPEAVRAVTPEGLGTVVPFGDVDAVEQAVRALLDDPVGRRAIGGRAHASARRDHDWAVHGPRFVEVLRTASATA